MSCDMLRATFDGPDIVGKELSCLWDCESSSSVFIAPKDDLKIVCK